MRPLRTLAALVFGLTAFAIAPAQADPKPDAETVSITLDLNASAAEIYESIRQQAWAACKPDQGSHHIAARMNARRSCQTAKKADVVETHGSDDVIRLAQDRGIRIKS